MKRIGRKLPLFELSMLLILVVLGWAAAEMYRVWLNYSNAERQWRQEFRQAENDWKRYVLDVRTLYTAVFDAQHTVKLRETYDSLAARLRVDLPEMHNALTNAALTRATNELNRFEFRSGELRGWLRNRS